MLFPVQLDIVDSPENVILNPPRADEESLPTGVSLHILQGDHASVPLREHETLRPPSEGLRVTQLVISVLHSTLMKSGRENCPGDIS
jgi:hypothetical protein